MNRQPSNNATTRNSACIGRDGELDEIRSLILDQGVPIVTVTGPPGSGRTTLIQQAGAQLASDFEGGFTHVDLTEISTEIQLARAVARGYLPS